MLNPIIFVGVFASLSGAIPNGLTGLFYKQANKQNLENSEQKLFSSNIKYTESHLYAKTAFPDDTKFKKTYIIDIAATNTPIHATATSISEDYPILTKYHVYTHNTQSPGFKHNNHITHSLKIKNNSENVSLLKNSQHYLKSDTIIKRGYSSKADLKTIIANILKDILSNGAKSDALINLPDLFEAIANRVSEANIKKILISLHKIAKSGQVDNIIQKLLLSVNSGDLNQIFESALSLIQSGALDKTFEAFSNDSLDFFLKNLADNIESGILNAFFKNIADAIRSGSLSDLMDAILESLNQGSFNELIDCIVTLIKQILELQDRVDAKIQNFINIIDIATKTLRSGKLDDVARSIVNILINAANESYLYIILDFLNNANSNGSLNTIFEALAKSIEKGFFITGAGSSEIIDALTKTISSGVLDDFFLIIAENLNSNIVNGEFSILIDSLLSAAESGAFKEILEALTKALGGSKNADKNLLDLLKCFEAAISNPDATQSGIVLKDLSLCSFGFISTMLLSDSTSYSSGNSSPSGGVEKLLQIILSNSASFLGKYGKVSTTTSLGNLFNALMEYKSEKQNEYQGSSDFGNLLYQFVNMVKNSKVKGKYSSTELQNYFGAISTSLNEGNGPNQNFGTSLQSMLLAIIETLVKVSETNVEASLIKDILEVSLKSLIDNIFNNLSLGLTLPQALSDAFGSFIKKSMELIKDDSNLPRDAKISINEKKSPRTNILSIRSTNKSPKTDKISIRSATIDALSNLPSGTISAPVPSNAAFASLDSDLIIADPLLEVLKLLLSNISSITSGNANIINLNQILRGFLIALQNSVKSVFNQINNDINNDIGSPGVGAPPGVGNSGANDDLLNESETNTITSASSDITGSLTNISLGSTTDNVNIEPLTTSTSIIDDSIILNGVSTETPVISTSKISTDTFTETATSTQTTTNSVTNTITSTKIETTISTETVTSISTSTSISTLIETVTVTIAPSVSTITIINTFTETEPAITNTFTAIETSIITNTFTETSIRQVTVSEIITNEVTITQTSNIINTITSTLEKTNTVLENFTTTLITTETEKNIERVTEISVDSSVSTLILSAFEISTLNNFETITNILTLTETTSVIDISTLTEISTETNLLTITEATTNTLTISDTNTDISITTFITTKTDLSTITETTTDITTAFDTTTDITTTTDTTTNITTTTDTTTDITTTTDTITDTTTTTDLSTVTDITTTTDLLTLTDITTTTDLSTVTDTTTDITTTTDLSTITETITDITTATDTTTDITTTTDTITDITTTTDTITDTTTTTDLSTVTDITTTTNLSTVTDITTTTDLLTLTDITTTTDLSTVTDTTTDITTTTDLSTITETITDITTATDTTTDITTTTDTITDITTTTDTITDTTTTTDLSTISPLQLIYQQ
ncbi:hypothetical protein BB561_001211 [Smittium simulii]|uniref:Uncharacterized protein n=1 Tax=Smittium simulii TaxID=133385 RepID=A0A2T9YVP1_9FUNG|nr:hypothetical protein BB561_001211 [Smittium simulii]